MRVVNEKKLNEVLEFVQDFQREKGRTPSYREIMHNVSGLGLATAHSYVNILEKRGLLEKTDIGNIAISKLLSIDSTITAPVVGTVACGSPILAEQNIEETYKLPVSLFGRDDLIGLHAKGESMVGVGIFDGDTVFYLPCSDAENGEIVVALIENEATIKRLEKRNGYAILHPENPEFSDIVTTNLVIQGVVKAVVHKF